MVSSLARDIAPHDIALARPRLTALSDHARGLRGNQICERVAGDLYETMRPQQHLDLGLRAAAVKRQLIADCGVFAAGAGVLALRRRRGIVVLRAVDDDE